MLTSKRLLCLVLGHQWLAQEQAEAEVAPLQKSQVDERLLHRQLDGHEGGQEHRRHDTHPARHQ